MLQKNNERYKLSPTEIKAIEKHFHGKFPVKLVYPPARIVKSRLKHNRRPDKPNSIAFDLKADVKTDSGIEVWRYFENEITLDRGEKRYTPRKFNFKGSTFLQRNDIELIFFLLKKSPYCKEGDNQGPIVKFMFEDLVSEAEKRAEKKMKSAKVDTLVYDTDKGLSVEKIRNIAKAMGIANVDNLKDAQVRVALDDRMVKPGNLDKFLAMADMEGHDAEMAIRIDIQSVIDKHLLRFVPADKMWYWTVEGQKKGRSLCRVTVGTTPLDTLFNLYKADTGFQDDIKAVLLTGKVDSEGDPK